MRHSRVGNGKGMIPERGYYPATSLHSDRLRLAPAGHFFQVITHGLGAMPDYAQQVSPADRWAVVAYIRALQLSQHAESQDLPAHAAVRPLREVATQQGFESGFLDSWILPATPNLPAAPALTLAQVSPQVSPTTSSESAKASTPTAPNKATQPTQATSAELPEEGDTMKGKPASPTAIAMAKPVVEPANAALGETIYTRNCVACHQATLTGIPPMIPSLVGIVPKLGAPRILEILHQGLPEGKPPMPSFSALSDKEMHDLIAYLKQPQ